MAELGATTDPRSLIPGSPEAIVENARVLRGRAQATADTGEGLKRIDTGAWRGPASDAFHDKFSYEPVKWLQASDSLDTGVVVLETYAETLHWAQNQAGEAIRQWEQGQKATAEAKRQHDQEIAQAEAQNQANAASGNPARVQVAPFRDPGEAIRQNAQDALNRARQQLSEAGDRAAAALRAESAAAPKDRNWLGDFLSDLGEGAWNAVSGLVTTVWDILPIRGIWDADGYTDSLLASAQGIWHSVTHPVDFAKGAIGWDDWVNGHPGRAIGQILGGVVGGGVIGKLLKGAPGPKPHDKDSEPGRKPDEPATTPQARADVVRKGILDNHGKPLGVEDSKGVRIIDEIELNEIRQHFHDQLGEPTNVIQTPKGTVESWKINDDPKQTVTYRTYSKSGGPTIDINDVSDVDTKRFHVR